MRRFTIIALGVAMLAFTDVAAAEDAAPAKPATEPETKLQLGTDVGVVVPSTDTGTSQVATPDSEYGFSVAGYLRGCAALGSGGPASDRGPHLPPNTPLGIFGDWRNLQHVANTTWANLNLSYGGPHVRGTVVLGAYNFNDGAAPIVYTKPWDTQVGVYSAFLTLKQEDVGGSGVGVDWNVGQFGKGYGTAGRYNVGRYFTFLFGNATGLGETLGLQRAFGKYTVRLEHGVTVRGEQFNQATTIANHLHAFLGYAEQLTFGLHYADEFSYDRVQFQDYPDGDVHVGGAEVRWLPGPPGSVPSLLGEFYAGYSRLNANHADHLGGALGVIDALNGDGLRSNYFASQQHDIRGTVDSVLFEYNYSFGRLARFPKPFYSDGVDVNLSLFGFLNWVHSPNSGAGVGGLAGNAAAPTDPKAKRRYGAELSVTPVRFAWFGVRFDRLEPVVGDPSQRINVLAPRLVLRSNFNNTHEELSLQYARVWYGSNVAGSGTGIVGNNLAGNANASNGNATGWDQDIVTFGASMWF